MKDPRTRKKALTIVLEPPQTTRTEVIDIYEDGTIGSSLDNIRALKWEHWKWEAWKQSKATEVEVKKLKYSNIEEGRVEP